MNKKLIFILFCALFGFCCFSQNSEKISEVLDDEQISKVCIMPTYMAKGLEFDMVVIPNYNKENYSTSLDFNMLYVSVTRALHKLYLLK